MIGLYAKRDGLELCYPPAGTSAINLSPGASWAWSTWAVLDSSLDDDFVMTGVVIWEAISYSTGGNVLEQCKIQVGRGALGVETPVATVMAGIAATADVACTHAKTVFKHSIAPTPPTFMRRGERISVRATKSSTGTYVLGIRIYGYSPRDMPPVRDYPQVETWLRNRWPNTEAEALSSGTVLSPVTGSTSTTWGAWIEAIAANAISSPLLITGAATDFVAASSFIEIQFGTGDVNREVPRAMVPTGSRATLPGPGLGPVYLPRPLLIMPNERVVCRVRGTAVSTTFTVIPIWMEVP